MPFLSISLSPQPLSAPQTEPPASPQPPPTAPTDISALFDGDDDDDDANFTGSGFAPATLNRAVTAARAAACAAQVLLLAVSPRAALAQLAAVRGTLSPLRLHVVCLQSGPAAAAEAEAVQAACASTQGLHIAVPPAAPEPAVGRALKPLFDAHLKGSGTASSSSSGSAGTFSLVCGELQTPVNIYPPLHVLPPEVQQLFPADASTVRVLAFVPHNDATLRQTLGLPPLYDVRGAVALLPITIDAGVRSSTTSGGGGGQGVLLHRALIR